MKDGNYYTVYGWMINQLKLKGTTLQLYAVIYGFSENGICAFGLATAAPRSPYRHLELCGIAPNEKCAEPFCRFRAFLLAAVSYNRDANSPPAAPGGRYGRVFHCY